MTYPDDYDHVAEFAEPTATRVLRHCASQRAIDLEVLDRRHGYLVRLCYEGRKVILQSRFVTSNSAVAMNLSKDKVYTYLVLKKAGIVVPRGDFFFVAEYFHRNSYATGKSLKEAVEYGKALAGRIGYPLIVKPAHLKQSRGVSKVFREIDVEAAISGAVKQSEFMVIVQEFIPGPEYRVVLVNDRVTACYRKMDRRVVGDGKQTVNELLLGTQNSGLGELEVRAIGFAGLDASSVLGQNETIVLDDINPFGVEPVDIETIHSSIVDVCRQSCAELGLRYAGVDLRCKDIRNAGRVVVIEVNGNPWLVDYFYSSAPARESVELTYGLLLADFLRLGSAAECKSTNQDVG